MKTEHDANEADLQHFAGQSERLRPLAILDLIRITTFIALIIALQKLCNRFIGLTDIYNIPMFSVAVVGGVFFASLFHFVQAKKQFGKYLLAPGYWIITILGAQAVLHLAMLIKSACLPGTSVSFIEDGFGLAIWILTLAAAIRNRGWWRIFLIFLLLPIGFISSTVLSATGSIGSSQLTWWILRLLQAIVLLAPVLSDIRNKVRRNWLHWVGIAMAIIVLVVVPLDYLRWYFAK